MRGIFVEISGYAVFLCKVLERYVRNGAPVRFYIRLRTMRE